MTSTTPVEPAGSGRGSRGAGRAGSGRAGSGRRNRRSHKPGPASPRSRTARAARNAAAIALWLVVWQLAALAVGVDFLLASPSAVVSRLVDLIPTADFWVTVGFSLGRIGLGFVAASIVGVALGVAAARIPLLGTMLAPLIAAVRSAPVVSFIILLLMWIGSGALAAATSFLMVLPVMYANAVEGTVRRDRALLEMATVFRLTWWQRVTTIAVPALAPFLVTATRSGVGLAWKSGVAAEVIGVSAGSIGERLYQAKVFLDAADLFAWTAVIVALSVVCERAILALLARLPGGATAPTGAAVTGGASMPASATHPPGSP